MSYSAVIVIYTYSKTSKLSGHLSAQIDLMPSHYSSLHSIKKLNKIMRLSNSARKLFEARPADETSKPSVRVIRMQMRSASTFQQARMAAKAFQGKPLVNQHTGMVAIIACKSLDKMLSKTAVTKSENPTAHAWAVANAGLLFACATHGWSKPDRGGNADIKGIHRFFIRVRVDGRIKIVKLTIKEMTRETRNNPLYTLEIVAFESGHAVMAWLEAAARKDGVDLKKSPAGGASRRDSRHLKEMLTLEPLELGSGPQKAAPLGT